MTSAQWETQILALIAFMHDRHGIMSQQIMTQFGLDGQVRVSVDVQPKTGGRLRVGSMAIDSFPWTGTYYRGVPLEFTAVPAAGYVFSGWSMPTAARTSSISLVLADDVDIAASFTRVHANPVIFNEINYRSAERADAADWVELFNVTALPIDLSGWHFKDEEDDHYFRIPDATFIEGRGYLVLSQDLRRFSTRFPDIASVVGDFTFGLGRNGELIRLYDASENLVDQVSYAVGPPWPEQAVASGATLALKHPNLDNSVPQSWSTSEPYGTPGTVNFGVSTVIHSDEQVPEAFYLDQNYPNPFNPSTTIAFSIAQAMKVTVSVYDISGQKISELSNAHREAGSHSVVFDGTEMATGVYFYQVQTERFTATKKMLLIK
jgi:hypothetical protein